MDRTNISPYTPKLSDNSRSIELLSKQYRNFYDVFLDNHRQLNSGNTKQLQYNEYTNDAFLEKNINQNELW